MGTGARVHADRMDQPMAGRRKAVAEIIEPPPGRVTPGQRRAGFEIDEAALARACELRR